MNKSFLQDMLWSSLNRGSKSFANKNSKYLKGFLVLVCAALTAFPAMSQGQPDFPINFDDAAINYELADFGGTTSSIVADPMDATNMVVSIVKPAGSECWAGTTTGDGCLVNPIPFSTGNTSVTVDVLSPAVGVPFLVKVENCGNGGISSEIIVLTTVANAWETLTFDLANGCPNPIDLNSTYSKISVFPIFTCGNDACGLPNPGAGAMMDDMPFYIDNVMMAPLVPQALDLPITFDNPAVTYALENFGGINSVVGADPLDPNNAVVCAIKDVGSECWAGTTVGPGPDCLANPIPFAPGSMLMSVDVFSPVVGAPFLLKVEDCSNGGISSELLAFTTVANAWETLTFDFSNGCPAAPNLMNTYDKLSVFPMFVCGVDACGVANPGAGLPLSGSSFYFDNIMMAEIPTTAPITFCADLSCLPNGDAAAVTGSFNNGNPGANFLNQRADGLYCTTIDLPTGVETFRFFTATEQFEDLSGIEGEACATGTGTEVRREITVVAGVAQEVVYAWQSCDAACVPTPTADITFCVDLNCASIAAAAVAGSFNGNNPGADFLSDPDGDGVFCATVAVPEGDHTYRFFTGGNQFEDLTAIEGEACVTGMAPNVMRTITAVADVAQTVTFGWEVCEAMCPPGPEFPITFEDPDVAYSLDNFGGINSVIGVDPEDPNNAVVCATKAPGSQCWAGTTIGANCLESAVPFAAGSMIIAMDVYSPRAGVPFLLKVEDCSNGAISSEILAFTTSVNTWETLYFDFSNACPAPPNLANTYDKISVFPIFTCNPDACGVTNPGAGLPFDNTPFYFDNIMMCAPALPEITCPADVTLSCEDSTDPADTGMATTVDICGAAPVITSADVSTQGTGCDQYTYTITRTWTATDAAGNMATCEQLITVEDTTVPMITCPVDATIECDGDASPAGTGMATATDNCSTGTDLVVSFADVTTQGTDGCAQFEFEITRTWTATDACGLSATCVQTINIGSTAAATITCPASQTLNCNESMPAFNNTPAEFIAIGGTLAANCTSDLANFTITHSDNPINPGQLDFCPSAPAADRTITRTYLVTDACGNTSDCTQTFTFLPSLVGPVITSIPLDQTVDCAVNAFPQLGLFTADGTCSNLTYTVSGPSGSGTTGCPSSRIQYTYTATDECGRMASHTQTYTLTNEGPEFVCPVDICVIECPADTDMIQAQFDAYAGLATVISSCSETGISISNTFNPNSFIPQNCANPSIAVDNAIAYQIVRFIATDDCGRNATCTALVVIKDNEGPVMNGGVSVGLADCNDANLQQGYTDWANNQINGLSATDECSGGPVTFSYSPLSPNVDCSSGLATTEVSFTATDACGNATISASFYRIIDNGSGEPSMATVSGNLLTEEDEMVALAEVQVDGFTNDMMMTSTDGYYHFDLMTAQNYAIAPSRNDNPLNGITTYDLILLGQHLLELNQLDSPYKLIAADVNESGSITTLDLIELRRLILFIDDEFSSGKSWTFVDAAYQFPQPTNPFASTYPTTFNINNLTSSQIANFIGVKLGDLNASASPSLLQAGDTRSSDGTLNIKLEDQVIKAGQTYQLAFQASDFKDVAGFQFTLDFAADYLQVMDYEGSELSNMSANNFGFTKANEGKLTVSWNETKSVSMADDATLFEVSFTALQDVKLSEVLAINSSVTASEAYQADLRKEVALDFGQTVANNKEITLLQNQPNPFTQETVIGFQLPEATEATLTIYDVSGRVVYTQTNTYDAGMHQVMMDKADLGATGVLYYQLSTPEFNDTKKMIVLK